MRDSFNFYSGPQTKKGYCSSGNNFLCTEILIPTLDGTSLVGIKATMDESAER